MSFSKRTKQAGVAALLVAGTACGPNQQPAPETARTTETRPAPAPAPETPPVGTAPIEPGTPAAPIETSTPTVPVADFTASEITQVPTSGIAAELYSAANISVRKDDSTLLNAALRKLAELPPAERKKVAGPTLYLLATSSSYKEAHTTGYNILLVDPELAKTTVVGADGQIVTIDKLAKSDRQTLGAQLRAAQIEIKSDYTLAKPPVIDLNQIATTEPAVKFTALVNDIGRQRDNVNRDVAVAALNAELTKPEFTALPEPRRIAALAPAFVKAVESNNEEALLALAKQAPALAIAQYSTGRATYSFVPTTAQGVRFEQAGKGRDSIPTGIIEGLYASWTKKPVVEPAVQR